MKSVFSFTTDSYKYKSEIIKYIISIAIIFIIAIITYFIKYKLYNYILFILFIIFIWLTLAFWTRLGFVTENKENMDILNNKFKFKNEPYIASTRDFILLLNNIDVPTRLILNSLSQPVIVEISFDVKGRRGEFYNKEYYFNNNKVSLDVLIKKLGLNSKTSIKILEYNNDDPKLFYNDLNIIKSKLNIVS